jgi:hypothetical protein
MSQFKKNVTAITAALNGDPTQMHANHIHKEFRRRLIRHLNQAVRTYNNEIMAIALAAPPTRIKAAKQLDEAKKDAELILKALHCADTL